MLRTAGKPVMAVQKGLNELFAKRITDYDVMGVGTTGSGRNLAGALVGADIIKNEITAHAVAASINVPGVQTILEIGGLCLGWLHRRRCVPAFCRYTRHARHHIAALWRKRRGSTSLWPTMRWHD